MIPRFNIGNVKISATNLMTVLETIQTQAAAHEPAYICVTNVRATYIANHDDGYCHTLNNSLLTVPDGQPLEWYARIIGLSHVEKTSGEDIFVAICRISVANKYSHFFLGSTYDVLNKMTTKLRAQYPRIDIVGQVAPPIGSAEELATDEIVNRINLCKPTFVWIGLGAPKQEKFMKLIVDHIENSIMLGVGLVFDYQAGTVRRAPKWMRHCGLEGLYRCAQQPQRVTLRGIGMLLSIIPKLLTAWLKRKRTWKNCVK